MALIRWEPARELSTLQSEVNRLFSSFFDGPVSAEDARGARRWVPAMDVVETDEHFVLRADLPGLDPEAVSIEVEDNVLTLSGERQEEHETAGEGFHRVERASGAFRRTLTLPQGVDPEAIAASFDRGVLEVRIPKPEQRRPRKVAVAVGAGEQPVIEGSESSR